MPFYNCQFHGSMTGTINIVDNNNNGSIIETSSNTNTGGSSPSYGYSLDLDIPYSFEQDIIPTSGYDI